MEDVITRVCRETGRSRTELAILFECDGSLIANTVAGAPKNLGKKILKGLAELGYDPVELAAEYQSYRASLREGIRAELLAREAVAN